MRQRRAFTLVEMLVALALVLFIMVLLAQAFTAGLETFQKLKAIGDMEDKLRLASTILRRDLNADHFSGRKRLSEKDFFNEGPPREGFLRIWQGSPAIIEGYDGDNLLLSRSVSSILHMTVKLRGNGPQDFFTADVSADPDTDPPPPLRPPRWSLLGVPASRYQSPFSYNSQWAEVAYFLRFNGDSANGQPLYSLYRRQLLAVPDNLDANYTRKIHRKSSEALDLTRDASTAYAGISCKENPIPLDDDDIAGQKTKYVYFNNPMDLTVPQRRFGLDPQLSPDSQLVGGFPVVRPDPNDRKTWTYPTIAEVYKTPSGLALNGADLLLADVLSFEVKVLVPESLTGVRYRAPSGNPQTGFDPFVDLFDSEVLQPVFQAGPDPVQTHPVLQSKNPLFRGNNPRVFDTWSSVQDGAHDYKDWNDTDSADPVIQSKRLPLRINILAIQITLRVWDRKTQNTRQITIVQDM
jgi:prepilin-type N-terminal cleavage/methylation domain-containing protein